jgi:D-alanine-D-alanine ligase
VSAARRKVAVIFGGRSQEHEVSQASAASIMTHLDRDRYDVVPVEVTTSGNWRVDGGSDDVAALPSLLSALPVLRRVDVVFPALHGRFGEDGTLQSILDSLGVPYVGNGAAASAMGMDKEFTKRLLAAEGLAVAPGVLLDPRRFGPEVECGQRPGRELSAVAHLGLPVFVKPTRAGSSIGVSRVDDWANLGAAIRTAGVDGRRVLVEAEVAGREIDLGVLEHPDGRLEVAPALEIRAERRHSFFTFDAKYTDTQTVFDVPARLEPDLEQALRGQAIRVFQALGCAGLLRVDFLLRGGSEPVVNEVNTFPGFTAASQYPRMWQAAGLSYPALLDILIDTALTAVAVGVNRNRFSRAD